MVTGNCPLQQGSSSDDDKRPEGCDRRVLLYGSGIAAAGIAAGTFARRMLLPRASVFIARHQQYDGRLVQTIKDGLLACDFEPASVRGKRVLLKPNLIEPSPTTPQVTTHPSMILAAAEVFRRWGAYVSVGEASGHARDTEMALIQAGLKDELRDEKLIFEDLNYQEVRWVANAGGACELPGFYFPQAVVEADLVVSMPKMKTHHWMGVTASMKNMYGVMPGIAYGWPKNVLHHAGIPQTVIDINASVPPTIAIVDGITCMEGDGPIMGSAKEMGLVVVGTVPAAVDATVCRLMGVDPRRISYLALAADRMGPIARGQIDQRGERWKPLAQSFTLIDVPHLKGMQLPDVS